MEAADDYGSGGDSADAGSIDGGGGLLGWRVKSAVDDGEEGGDDGWDDDYCGVMGSVAWLGY